MENLNFEYLLLAFLGMFIHILMKIADRDDKTGNKFSFRKFFSDRMNWVRMLLSVSSIIALLMMAEDLADMFGITLKDGTLSPKVFAFGAGYLNHSLIRNVLRMFKKGVSSHPQEG